MQKRKRVDLSNAPSKKRKKTFGVEEVTYDASAREDFLTGFHKRKLQRAKHAREEAAKKEKAERLEARKNRRQARKEDLEKHVAEVNAMVKAANKGPGSESSSSSSSAAADEDGDEAPGADVAAAPLDTEDEYVDEDRHTTVTIEAVSVTRDGLEKAGGADASADEEDAAPANGSAVEETKDDGAGRRPASAAKRTWTKERPGGPKKKKEKKKSFRYESKAERKVTRLKERSGNKRQAKERKG